MKFRLFCSENYGTFQMLEDISFSILKYEKHDLGRQQIFSNSTFTFFMYFTVYLENKINAEKFWHECVGILLLSITPQCLRIRKRGG